ncbi:MAG: sulfatase-like hydrolase/transferase [Planctomycetota bacterium]|jgi:arylsulfatase A
MKNILTFCYSLLLLLLTANASAEVKQPNVVILLADDLGSKDIGCYGGPVKTPVLDELAEKGVRFTAFHAGAAICSPSRATLITGRQHLRTGIYGVLQDHMHDMHLLEREVTIPELLQQAGYGTAHFGKWHIGMTSGERKKPSPTEHGFDYWFGLSNGAHPSHKDPVNFLRNGERVGPLKGYSCQLIVDDAIRWLDEKKNPDQAFFLNLWFNEPHHKLAAPDEIVSAYGDLKDEAAIYSATVDNTDRAIGRLVAKLKAMGELDNTLIIYSSDHGSYRTDRNGGLKGNKGSNFQGGLRSPGIFFWPDGFRGGRTEDTPSGSVDLLPTICGLIGIDKPAGVHLDGADLSPLLTEKGTFKRDQPLLWLAPSSGHLATLREGDYTLMGYRGYQLPFDHVRFNEVLRRMAELAGIDPKVPNLIQAVSNTTFSSPEFNRLNFERVRLQTFQEAWIPAIKAGGFSRFALYDLSSDPLQKNDISKQHPEVTGRLKQKLLALYKDVMADAPDWGQKPRETTSSNPSSPGLSPEDRELSDLLTRIDQTELPDGYDVTNHQPWVDRRMEALKPEQRGRIGRLWKEKRRLQPKMTNAGMSFVRILEYVARGEKLAAESAPKPTAPLPQRKSKPVASKIDPKGLHWHQWRGPEANGVSRTAKPPLEWSEDRNIKWKVAIEGQGNASPIIWGDKVFVLTAINTGRVDPSLPKPEDQPKRVFGIKHPNTFYRFEVLCLDRHTGKELWRQTASEHVPHEGTHHDADFASASPTTDSERLYCWFGSAGLYCYDLDGKRLWERNLGKAYVGASLGEGCSPVVHDDRVIIVRDHARQSTIEVLDAKSGNTVWKKNRDEPNAWATPRVIEHSGKTQVITAASKMVRSYDLDTGDIIWQCSGLTGNVTPCPVVEDGVVYCMSGYEGYSLLALPLDAQGDISDSDNIIWSKDKGTPYVPSPVLYDGLLYFTQSNQGILTAVDSRSGDTVIERTRLPDIFNMYSSPVGADGRVYFTGRNGTTLVSKRSGKLEVLATNKLDDEFNSSPAIVGTQLFLRGRKSLYCIEDSTAGNETGTSRTSIEKKTRIHRLDSTKRSVFDAFSYVNRLPDKPYDEEQTDEFGGRIFGRLANQEGRVQIKTPPGVGRDAYEGFKTFLNFEGEASVGNCAACHSLPDFTDGKSHVVEKAGKPVPTPSLRNLGKRRVDLRAALQKKLDASRQKTSGKADEISDKYSAMRLSDADITQLIAFLKLLDDVPDKRFRELIIEATVLDTSSAGE